MNNKMKILYLPFEVAGQLSLSVKGLKRLGTLSDLAVEKHAFNYPADYVLTFPKNWILRRIKSLYYTIRLMRRYDIYHYHFGCSLLPLALDARLNNFFGRKSLVEFWGSDIRIPDIEEARNQYYPGADHYNESRKKAERRMKRWSQLTGGVAIVADHSFNEQLFEHYTTIYNVGQRMDVKEIDPHYPDSQEKCPVIVHAPSHQGVKGSNKIEAALEELKVQGFSFKYIRATGLSHADAMDVYKTADLIIDQLCLGTHGVFACEAMTLGKPVICYIMNSLRSGYPEGLPIINATPDNIQEVLAKWIDSPKERAKQGRLSREYAEKVHDLDSVAKRLQLIYDNHLNDCHPKGIIDLRQPEYND